MAAVQTANALADIPCRHTACDCHAKSTTTVQPRSSTVLDSVTHNSPSAGSVSGRQRPLRAPPPGMVQPPLPAGARPGRQPPAYGSPACGVGTAGDHPAARRPVGDGAVRAGAGRWVRNLARTCRRGLGAWGLDQGQWWVRGGLGSAVRGWSRGWRGCASQGDWLQWGFVWPVYTVSRWRDGHGG